MRTPKREFVRTLDLTLRHPFFVLTGMMTTTFMTAVPLEATAVFTAEFAIRGYHKEFYLVLLGEVGECLSVTLSLPAKWGLCLSVTLSLPAKDSGFVGSQGHIFQLVFRCPLPTISARRLS